jgi:predicted transcriptional regulator
VIHEEALQVLVNNLQDDLAEMHEGIKKGYRRLVQRTQLTAARDKLVTEQVAQGIGAGKARREVSKRINEALIGELGDKPLIINGRHYDPKKYAEMVTRTMTRQAQTNGTINRTLEAGVDTVMVTAHGAQDGCGFYEGKAFSISGTHPDYPPLDSLPNGGPPFHPNCKHVLAPFVESFASGAEKRRAQGVPSEALGVPMKDVEKLAKENTT